MMHFKGGNVAKKSKKFWWLVKLLPKGDEDEVTQ